MSGPMRRFPVSEDELVLEIDREEPLKLRDSELACLRLAKVASDLSSDSVLPVQKAKDPIQKLLEVVGTLKEMVVTG